MHVYRKLPPGSPKWWALCWARRGDSSSQVTVTVPAYAYSLFRLYGLRGSAWALRVCEPHLCSLAALHIRDGVSVRPGKGLALPPAGRGHHGTPPWYAVTAFTLWPESDTSLRLRCCSGPVRDGRSPRVFCTYPCPHRVHAASQVPGKPGGP